MSIGSLEQGLSDELETYDKWVGPHKGQKVFEAGQAYQLREKEVSYMANFGPENDDIRAENGYF